jgi:hypothetical protein
MSVWRDRPRHEREAAIGQRAGRKAAPVAQPQFNEADQRFSVTGDCRAPLAEALRLEGPGIHCPGASCR